MVKESEYCSKTIEIKSNRPLIMTEKEHEDLKSLQNVAFVKRYIKKVK